MPTLNWIGKDKVITHHNDVPYKVLEHQYGFSVDAETGKAEENKIPTNSGNKVIHGDNLEALKSLLPEYEGKIDCIYIDPPYNTGNENWIYNDNVNHPKIKKWIGEIVGDEGEDLTRHDKWLCMMYPRLKLLHQLLSNSGVIFISLNFIHEYPYLRCVMDEIFGKNNHIGEITWESTTQPINSGSAKFGLQQKVEPILLYGKNKMLSKAFRLKEIEGKLKYPHIGKLGKCRFEIIEKSDAGDYKRDTMKFQILGQYPRDGKRWQIGEELANDLIKNNRIEIVDGIVKRAYYPEDELDKRKYEPFWSHLSAGLVGTAQTGKDILNSIMNEAIGFDTVKPPNLIKKLISHIVNKDAIILDSFAGSGTTAHAVLNLNKEDGGNRKFILIEMEDYANDITAERVKRVAKGYGEGNKAVEGTGGSFDYYKLGVPLFDEHENLNEEVGIDKIREYVWYSETRSSDALVNDENDKYLLGKNNDTVYYFIYEKKERTTLDFDSLNLIKTKGEQYVIYADNCLLPKAFMVKHGIVFKKIPRDISKL